MTGPRIISIATVAEPWEYLYVSTERGGREIFSETVLVWGLTETGTVQPVTATGNLRPDLPNALRRVEDGRIFSSAGQYETKEEWLKSLREADASASPASPAPMESPSFDH